MEAKPKLPDVRVNRFTNHTIEKRRLYERRVSVARRRNIVSEHTDVEFERSNRERASEEAFNQRVVDEDVGFLHLGHGGESEIEAVEGSAGSDELVHKETVLVLAGLDHCG